EERPGPAGEDEGGDHRHPACQQRRRRRVTCGTGGAAGGGPGVRRLRPIAALFGPTLERGGGRVRRVAGCVLWRDVSDHALQRGGGACGLWRVASHSGTLRATPSSAAAARAAWGVLRPLAVRFRPHLGRGGGGVRPVA